MSTTLFVSLAISATLGLMNGNKESEELAGSTEISTILSIMIGLKREFKQKRLGSKTRLIVCIISCLLTIISVEPVNRISQSYLL